MSIIAVTNTSKHTAKLHHVASLYVYIYIYIYIYILTYDARKLKHKIDEVCVNPSEKLAFKLQLLPRTEVF